MITSPIATYARPLILQVRLLSQQYALISLRLLSILTQLTLKLNSAALFISPLHRDLQGSSGFHGWLIRLLVCWVLQNSTANPVKPHRPYGTKNKGLNDCFEVHPYSPCIESTIMHPEHCPNCQKTLYFRTYNPGAF